MSESPNPIVNAITDFAKGGKREITCEIDEYFAAVSKTGQPIVEWEVFRPAFLTKLEQVMREVVELCPFDHLPPQPNVAPCTADTMLADIMKAATALDGIPFTIQRLCELLVDPRKYYNRSDKFLRAIDKNIQVVTTVTAEEVSRKAKEDADAESTKPYSDNRLVQSLMSYGDADEDELDVRGSRGVHPEGPSEEFCCTQSLAPAPPRRSLFGMKGGMDGDKGEASMEEHNGPRLDLQQFPLTESHLTLNGSCALETDSIIESHCSVPLATTCSPTGSPIKGCVSDSPGVASTLGSPRVQPLSMHSVNYAMGGNSKSDQDYSASGILLSSGLLTGTSDPLPGGSGIGFSASGSLSDSDPFRKWSDVVGRPSGSGGMVPLPSVETAFCVSNRQPSLDPATASSPTMALPISASLVGLGSLDPDDTVASVGCLGGASSPLDSLANLAKQYGYSMVDQPLGGALGPDLSRSVSTEPPTGAHSMARSAGDVDKSLQVDQSVDGDVDGPVEEDAGEQDTSVGGLGDVEGSNILESSETESVGELDTTFILQNPADDRNSPGFVAAGSDAGDNPTTQAAIPVTGDSNGRDPAFMLNVQNSGDFLISKKADMVEIGGAGITREIDSVERGFDQVTPVTESCEVATEFDVSSLAEINSSSQDDDATKSGSEEVGEVGDNLEILKGVECVGNNVENSRAEMPEAADAEKGQPAPASPSSADVGALPVVGVDDLIGSDGDLERDSRSDVNFSSLAADSGQKIGADEKEMGVPDAADQNGAPSAPASANDESSKLDCDVENFTNYDELGVGGMMGELYREPELEITSRFPISDHPGGELGFDQDPAAQEGNGEMGESGIVDCSPFFSSKIIGNDDDVLPDLWSEEISDLSARAATSAGDLDGDRSEATSATGGTPSTDFFEVEIGSSASVPQQGTSVGDFDNKSDAPCQTPLSDALVNVTADSGVADLCVDVHSSSRNSCSPGVSFRENSASGEITPVLEVSDGIPIVTSVFVDVGGCDKINLQHDDDAEIGEASFPKDSERLEFSENEVPAASCELSDPLLGSAEAELRETKQDNTGALDQTDLTPGPSLMSSGFDHLAAGSEASSYALQSENEDKGCSASLLEIIDDSAGGTEHTDLPQGSREELKQLGDSYLLPDHLGVLSYRDPEDLRDENKVTEDLQESVEQFKATDLHTNKLPVPVIQEISVESDCYLPEPEGDQLCIKSQDGVEHSGGSTSLVTDDHGINSDDYVESMDDLEIRGTLFEVDAAGTAVNDEKAGKICELRDSALLTEEGSTTSSTEKDSTTPLVEEGSTMSLTEKDSTTLLAEEGSKTSLTEKGSATPLAEENSTTSSTEKSSIIPLAEEGSTTSLTEKGSATPLAEEGSATILCEEGSSTSLAEDGSTTFLAEEGSTISLAEEGSTTFLAEEGSTTSLAEEGSTTFLAEEGSTISLAEEASTTFLAEEGSTTSLAEEGSTTFLAEEGSTISLAEEGSTTFLAEEGSTTSLAEEGSTTFLAEEGSTTSLAEEGSTTLLTEEGSTTSLAEEGSTTSLAEEGSATSLAEEGSTTVLAEEGSTTFLAEEGSTTPLTEEGATTSLAEKGSTTSLSAEGSTTRLIEDGLTASLGVDGVTTSLAEERSIELTGFDDVVSNESGGDFPDQNLHGDQRQQPGEPADEFELRDAGEKSGVVTGEVVLGDSNKPDSNTVESLVSMNIDIGDNIAAGNLAPPAKVDLKLLDSEIGGREIPVVECLEDMTRLGRDGGDQSANMSRKRKLSGSNHSSASLAESAGSTAPHSPVSEFSSGIPLKMARNVEKEDQSVERESSN